VVVSSEELMHALNSKQYKLMLMVSVETRTVDEIQC